MTYQHDKPQSRKRDWTMIILLYLSVASMLVAGNFALQAYMTSGRAERCEAHYDHSN